MTYIPTVVKSFQRGTITIPNGAASASVAVTSVNTNCCSLRKLGSSLPSGSSADGFAGINLASATQINAFRATLSNALTIDWELVEYYPNVVSRVQRGLTNTANVYNVTQAIASVNVYRAHVHHLGNTTVDGVSGNSANWMTRVELQSATVLMIYLGFPASNTTTSWEIVEFF